MLELRNVTKEFINNKKEEVAVLNNINLKVGAGDFLSIVGPSGSGKSTLLFIIGALMNPTEGEVLLRDKDIYDTRPAYRAKLRLQEIGFVFQTFNLIPYLSALDNVAVPAVINMRSRNSAVERAEDLLKRFGLGARLDHKFSELSVGERQRVALCRSVINDPKIILADEPTGNLDPAMTHEVMALFQELNKNGHTIIVVTHEEDVAAYARKVMHLKDGKFTNGTIL
ncbi:MAG: ABC transporter ATP-binding protein [Thermodesulfovibrionia bacterium]|nr:ABC transporter ATP-binding protein [Thermodesulfovibrionia bacterium]